MIPKTDIVPLRVVGYPAFQSLYRLHRELYEGKGKLCEVAEVDYIRKYFVNARK